jgi:hypothetical protein
VTAAEEEDVIEFESFAEAFAYAQALCSHDGCEIEIHEAHCAIEEGECTCDPEIVSPTPLGTA